MHSYLTVDYERGNFSVSQNVWQDGAAQQISAILSPTYAKSAGPSKNSGSKPIGAGAIAGAVIGSIAVLLIAGSIWYFISRSKRQTLTPPAEDVGLSKFEPDYHKDTKDGSLYYDPASPHLPEKKLNSTGSMYRSADGGNGPDGELGTQGEIFQLPTQRDQEDYLTAVDRIVSERRAGSTPEIDGRIAAYELHGSEPMPVEMDDERSRVGLTASPTSATFSPGASLSPTSPSPGIALPVSRLNSRISGPLSGQL